jgi:hypothetical protein
MGTWLGGTPAIAGSSTRRRTCTLWLLSILLIAACGGDNDPDASPPSTDPPGSEGAAGTEAPLLPCAEDRHLVAVDIVGFLTAEQSTTIIGPWIVGVSPAPRAGAPEVFQAYRDRGYELLYISLLPQASVPNLSLPDMFTDWLASGGFPTGPGTSVFVPETAATSAAGTWVAITDQLLSLAAEGVSIDAAYTESPDYSHAYSTAGVPTERNYSLTPVTIVERTLPDTPVTRIPNDDMVAHAGEVAGLPPVCEVG